MFEVVKITEPNWSISGQKGQCCPECLQVVSGTDANWTISVVYRDSSSIKLSLWTVGLGLSQ